MAENSFRSRLLAKDKKGCHEYLKTHLDRKKLVLAIHDLLFLSIYVNAENVSVHPVCLVNSIKNFISDDKENPSIKLLLFIIDYLFQFENRKNDQNILDESCKKGLVKSAFVGDLENACQNGEWDKAQSLMAELFTASDQSRGTFDALAELALQDCPKNALFVYHILRAYQFQEYKRDNWNFTCALFSQLKNNKLPEPHHQEKFELEVLLENVIRKGDIVLFSAMKRILETTYVRSAGYNREISYWLSKMNFFKKNNPNEEVGVSKHKPISFISKAEEIIEKEQPTDQKVMELVSLEALRSLMKNINKNNYETLISRFSSLIL